jgi:hypothetical protein
MENHVDFHPSARLLFYQDLQPHRDCLADGTVVSQHWRLLHGCPIPNLRYIPGHHSTFSNLISGRATIRNVPDAVLQGRALGNVFQDSFRGVHGFG